MRYIAFIITIFIFLTIILVAKKIDNIDNKINNLYTIQDSILHKQLVIKKLN